MTVYFIADDELKTVKIGFTADQNPAKRIAALQTANARELRVIGYNSDADIKHEKAIHQLLGKFRGLGEWFDYTVDEVREVCDRVIGGWLPSVVVQPKVTSGKPLAFSSYSTMFDSHKKSHPKVKREEFYLESINAAREILSDKEALLGLAENWRVEDAKKLFQAALSEFAWYEKRRPFYNVYPKVVEALVRTKLNFRLSQLEKPFGPVAICFADGHQPFAPGKDRKPAKLSSMLVEYNDTFRDLLGDKDVVINRHLLRISMIRENSLGQFAFSIMHIPDNDKTIYEHMKDSAEVMDPLDSVMGKAETIALALGVIMLAEDPDFSAPILLAADRDKVFKSQEDHDRAVDKAIRRGVNGVAIGKNLEVSPHLRVPHFAIRWMREGDGPLVPRLRPIKGSIVKRDNLYPIPTGYMDEEPAQT